MSDTQAAERFLTRESSYLKSWRQVLREVGLPVPTYNLFRHDLEREIREAQAAVWLEAAALIPTNWCDPLLTGDKAVLKGYDYNGTDIERLLRAIKERIEQQAQAAEHE